MKRDNMFNSIHYGRGFTCIIKHVILVSSLFLSSTARADIAVIVNADRQDVKLGRNQIQQIFLGIKNTLPNGTKVSPIDLSQDTNVRELFYKIVADRSPVEMHSYWARQIFTGRGYPPEVLPTQNAVISKVASDKDAIGYVNASSVVGNVKVALLIPTQ